ncbi:ion transporter [Porphyromonas macacae]|uniref:ion transporter n=1 Tax=Porphyromonas macacae TaxID=28115 RepID=UPI0024ACD843|nr:ion transporter [Porphyromonas macacae]
MTFFIRKETLRSAFSKKSLRRIIFGAETPGGKIFDILLLIVIILSVVVVLLDSMPDIPSAWHRIFNVLEWIFTVVFTLEYILRVYCAGRRKSYVLSFMGLVDLISFLPTYLSFIFPSFHFLLVVRGLRIIRAFKIMQMGQYIRQGDYLYRTIRASIPKISVFMVFVALLVILLGCLMYLIESPINPRFSSIPRAVYWAVVTLTTVGYGDITPVTGWGQFLSVVVMLLGYSIIAVPTGIVSGEMAKNHRYLYPKRIKEKNNRRPVCYCYTCGRAVFDAEALFCPYCGEGLIKSQKKQIPPHRRHRDTDSEHLPDKEQRRKS